MNRKIILVVAAFALILGAGVITTSKVYADDNDRRFGPMIDALVERFGLNEDEVATFMEEQRSERQQQMKLHFEEKLDDAVAKGVITEDQKQALLTKHEEITQERMHNHEEFEVWAEEQGINLEELGLFGYGFRGHGHRGMMKGYGQEL